MKIIVYGELTMKCIEMVLIVEGIRNTKKDMKEISKREIIV